MTPKPEGPKFDQGTTAPEAGKVDAPKSPLEKATQAFQTPLNKAHWEFVFAVLSSNGFARQ